MACTLTLPLSLLPLLSHDSLITMDIIFVFIVVYGLVLHMVPCERVPVDLGPIKAFTLATTTTANLPAV